MAVIKKNLNYMGLPLAIYRESASPLDTTEIWYSLAELEEYAAHGPTAYVGQLVAYINEETGEGTAYIIANEEGKLQRIGSFVDATDEATLTTTNDGLLTLVNYGKEYYKWIEPVGAPGDSDYVEGYYELVTVDAEHPWVAELEPRVITLDDGSFSLGWFEQVDPIVIQNVAQEITNVTEKVENITQEIAEVTDVLYSEVDPETGETINAGLIDRVEENEAAILDLENELSQVKEDMGSVFNYKGIKENKAALEAITDMETGDVWQVGQQEYAWNGAEWIELGLTVNLSGYATEEWVSAQVKNVADELALVENDVVENGEAIASLTEANEEFATHFETVDGRLETLETAKSDFTTHFEVVDGKIEALEAADKTFDNTVNGLAAKVGAPSENSNITSLFPAVEALQNTVKDLQVNSGAGELNVINGISINGTNLNPDDSKIVALPVFDGTNAGLVPNIAEGIIATDTTFLSAKGNWVDVAALIDSKLDEALVWEIIA